MSEPKYVLVLGAGGHVSKHTIPLLRERGHHVTALVRNPSHASALVEAGATVMVQDLTGLEPGGWERLQGGFQVVVWSAGAGGGDADRTWAVDRDAAMASIDALENLGEHAPRYIMVSYAGAPTAETEDDGGSWYAYVESKKAVDRRLLDSDLDVVVLGPTLLTDEPSRGLHVLEGAAREGSETSRELVAEVIAEMVERDTLPAKHIEFEDGTDPVSSL